MDKETVKKEQQQKEEEEQVIQENNNEPQFVNKLILMKSLGF